MPLLAKLGLTLGIVGWIIMALSTGLGIFTVGNVAIQTIAIYSFATGAAMIGVAIVIGICYLLEEIWK